MRDETNRYRAIEERMDRLPIPDQLRELEKRELRVVEDICVVRYLKRCLSIAELTATEGSRVSILFDAWVEYWEIVISLIQGQIAEGGDV